MINIVHTPTRNLNKFSQNTLKIIESIQNYQLSQSSSKLTSPKDTPSLPQSITLKDALASNKYTSIGMGLYKHTSNDDDYGKIWIKKSILNEKTGEIEDYLVVYVNDEDEIVRQAAMEEWQGVCKTSSQKTATDFQVYRNNPQYRPYFNYLMQLNNERQWGPGMFLEEGQDALLREFPELDSIEAGQILNMFLGEMGYFSEMGGFGRVSNKTASKKDDVDRLIMLSTGTDSLSEAVKVLKKDALDYKRAGQSIKEFVNDSFDMLSDYIGNLYSDDEPLPNGNYASDQLFEYLERNRSKIKKYYMKLLSSQKTAADVKPENIPIAPGIKSKNLSLDESGGAGTGQVTIEFTDVDKALDFYKNEVVPGGGETPKEEEIPQEEVQLQQQAPPQPQVQPKASNKQANYEEGVTEDQYGQRLTEGDRVKDDQGRRGEVTKVVGDNVYVNWDGVAEKVNAPITANTLTKWSSPTISEFSDGVMGVKVYKYTKQDSSYSNRKPWDAVLKEAMNQVKSTDFDKYSFVNEDGIEIPITLRKGIKIGEMFERPDNHELVRFAGWLKKEAISSQKTAATLDISIEAEDTVLDKIVEHLIEGVDEALNGDELEGGLADEKGEDEFDKEQLEKGEDVEMEHTDDEDIAKEIAKDHLMEMDDYYDKLEDMEDEGEKDKKESRLNKKSYLIPSRYPGVYIINFGGFRGDYDDEAALETLSNITKIDFTDLVNPSVLDEDFEEEFLDFGELQNKINQKLSENNYNYEWTWYGGEDMLVISKTSIPEFEEVNELYEDEGDTYSSKKTAGTWAIPNTVKKAQKLINFLDTLPVGEDLKDTEQLKDILYDIMGDDEIFDEIDNAEETLSRDYLVSIIKDKLRQWLQDSDITKDWDPEAVSMLKNYCFGKGNYSSKKIAKVVKDGDKWKVKSESGKTLGTHDTKEDAEEQLQAIEINKHKESKLNKKSNTPEFEDFIRGQYYDFVPKEEAAENLFKMYPEYFNSFEDALGWVKRAYDRYGGGESKVSKLNKKSDHAATLEFGGWVENIRNHLPFEKLDDYYKILSEYIPNNSETGAIIEGVDNLDMGQRIDLEHKLYNLLGMKESNMKSLSFGYDLGGDINDDWRDTDADDWLLNKPEDVFPSKGERYKVIRDTESGKWVVTDTERGGEIVFSDENMETAEHYARDKNYPPDESVASRVANESKTAADISDEIPPMSNVTDESQREDINSPQQATPLPPRPELNQSPGDVLYDSQKTKEDGSKFQVTTDPAEKTVTVKFLEEEQDNILNQAINEGAGAPLQSQPQQSFVNNQQKDFTDTDSQVVF